MYASWKPSYSLPQGLSLSLCWLHFADTVYCIITDSPKIQGPAAVVTWEGNPANITCEALAHPAASVLWFRDGQMLPSANTTNIKIYNTPAVSFLEVRHQHSNPSAFRCPLIKVSTLKTCLTLIIAF